MKVFRWVLQRQPGDPTALAGLAFAEWRRNADDRTAETLIALKDAVDRLPEGTNIRHAYVTVLSAAGDFDELAAQCRLLLQRDPTDVGAFAQLANSRRYTDEDDTLKAMQELADGGALTGERLSVACIGLAKAFDDLGRYDLAMKYAFAGRAASVRPYDMASERADLAEIQRLARGDGLSGIATSGVESKAPVFIVGMPRSGTTLLETMLGRHSQVFAAGELHFVGQVENALMRWLREDRGYMGNRVAALRHVPVQIYRENANVILDHMTGQMAGRRFFTDKNPENAMRLGLISRLFPGARILYMRRHPLDSCISNLFVRFGRGMEYGSKLEWLGEHYHNIVGAMAGWREITGLPILDVSYENLVEDPEAGITRVLDFLDLGFEEACLSPEQSDRIIRTASKFQARQPINRRSANRWKRYEPWIGPLVEALGGMEWIEREAAEARAAG
ncbi:MAG TPA: sulfotransferase [Devosiaceae bacterium]